MNGHAGTWRRAAFIGLPRGQWRVRPPGPDGYSLGQRIVAAFLGIRLRREVVSVPADRAIDVLSRVERTISGYLVPGSTIRRSYAQSGTPTDTHPIEVPELGLTGTATAVDGDGELYIEVTVSDGRGDHPIVVIEEYDSGHGRAFLLLRPVADGKIAGQFVSRELTLRDSLAIDLIPAADLAQADAAIITASVLGTPPAFRDRWREYAESLSEGDPVRTAIVRGL